MMRVLKTILLISVLLLIVVYALGSMNVMSSTGDIAWVYQYPYRYRDLYIREAAVCGDMVLVSPVSVSSSGEFYPFTMSMNVDTSDIMWTASVGGHLMCGKSGFYVLDDYYGFLYYLSYWGKVQNKVYINVAKGRWLAKTDYGIAVLDKKGIVHLFGKALAGGFTASTSYPPVDGGMLVSDGNIIFWKTLLNDQTALVAFDILKSKVIWVKSLNIHKSYIAPYQHYLFVSGFEKLYVLDKETGDVIRSYDVAYYEPYMIISGDKLLIPRKNWLDVFSVNGGLLVRVYKDSDMVFSAYSMAGGRILNVDSDSGKAYACTLTSDFSCVNRKVWTFSDAMLMGDKVYGTGLNFVIPVKDGWLVFLTYRVVPAKYRMLFDVVTLYDKGVSPRGDWETPFGGADGDGMP